MVNIHTARNIAFVHYDQTCGDRAIFVFPDKTMRRPHLSLPAHSPITLQIGPAFPKKAPFERGSDCRMECDPFGQIHAAFDANSTIAGNL